MQPWFEQAGAFAGATIAQPSFFAFGADDGIIRIRAPEKAQLRQVATNLRSFLQLDGVGHWPQLEATDRVNEALLGFLRDMT